jgi:uncharacterized protein (TIGR02246 family)
MAADPLWFFGPAMVPSQYMDSDGYMLAGMRSGLFFIALLAHALTLTAEDAVPAVRLVLDKQVADWNRGDISAFVQSYAENCTFVGKTVVEGRAGVEDRYRRNYSTPAVMGQLAFTDLKIKQIDSHVVLVTGAYRLARSDSDGGDKSGIFSLVLERQTGVWRIVLDHTS